MQRKREQDMFQGQPALCELSSWSLTEAALYAGAESGQSSILDDHHTNLPCGLHQEVDHQRQHGQSLHSFLRHCECLTLFLTSRTIKVCIVLYGILVLRYAE